MTANTQHKIYIASAKQISIQRPLSEEWMKEPIFHHEPLVLADDPSFREYISPKTVRRMGKLIKRALTTSLEVMKETGIEHPDAIITGTSIGSLNCTERFLDALIDNDEETLSPTDFMQSPHNTVGATIGIYTKTHGYNTTYSHGSLSFDLAMQDACMQMQLEEISNALVGGFDEMVPSYFELLKRTGYVGKKGMVPCGEVSMSMMLSNRRSSEKMCELSGIRIGCYESLTKFKDQVVSMLHNSGLTINDIDAVMTGINGNAENDRFYVRTCQEILSSKLILHYKHLFGENYTSSALGLYTAAFCLKRGFIPDCLRFSSKNNADNVLQNILVINHMNGGDEYSIILLKKI